MILDPQWAQITLDIANTSIRNGWHPSAALRATHSPAMTYCTSDTTAILYAWCPKARGHIQQAVKLVENQWVLA
jgi:hypothetical protein